MTRLTCITFFSLGIHESCHPLMVPGLCLEAPKKRLTMPATPVVIWDYKNRGSAIAIPAGNHSAKVVLILTRARK